MISLAEAMKRFTYPPVTSAPVYNRMLTEFATGINFSEFLSFAQFSKKLSIYIEV